MQTVQVVAESHATALKRKPLCGLANRLPTAFELILTIETAEPLSIIREAIQMNWDRVEGNWKQVKGSVKEQWGKLTDDQLDVIAGKRDQLVGKIEEAYGISKDEVEKQLAAWQLKLKEKSWS